jgi:thioredoxin reductase (NADPH)
MGAKDRKDAKGGKDGKDAKAGKDGKGRKDAKGGKDGKDTKAGKGDKDPKAHKDAKDRKDGKDGKDSKDGKDRKDGKDTKGGKDRFDFGILGAGMTGLAAAMYAARLGLKTLVIGNAGRRSAAMDIGGTITLTDVVENYPGFIRLTGEELAKKLEDHARSYDLVEIKNAWVDSVDKEKDTYFIHAGDDVYAVSALLVATGTRHRELDVPGHDELRNKGVQYCALCDGPLYKGKIVAVVGGSDSAAKEALLMAEHAKKVYLIARGRELRAEPINLDRVKRNKRITVILETNVKRIQGEKKVESVMLDREHDGSKELKLDGVFVAIGQIPLSDLAKDLGAKTNDKGEIVIDRDSRTNVKGLYAAGDVADRDFKQGITGVAEGVVAAYSAFQDIKGGIVVPSDDAKPHKH